MKRKKGNFHNLLFSLLGTSSSSSPSQSLNFQKIIHRLGIHHRLTPLPLPLPLPKKKKSSPSPTSPSSSHSPSSKFPEPEPHDFRTCLLDKTLLDRTLNPFSLFSSPQTENTVSSPSPSPSPSPFSSSPSLPLLFLSSPPNPLIQKPLQKPLQIVSRIA